MTFNYGKLTNGSRSVCFEDGIVFESLLNGHSRLFTLLFGISSVFMTIFMASQSEWIIQCLVYIFVFVLTLTRTITLFLDPYFTEKFFSEPRYDLLFQVDFPCFISSLAILMVIIKKATRRGINTYCINSLIAINFILYATFMATDLKETHSKVSCWQLF